MDTNHIYPVQLPEITVESGLDFLLLELPPRYLPMMPNGLGYVDKTLERVSVRRQTLDANIIIYHRYHSKRLLRPESFQALEGVEDLWDNTAVSQWSKPEVRDLFKSDFCEILQAIVQAKPRAVGFSIHGANRPVVNAFIKTLREASPETLVVLGGYDCVYPDTAKMHIPDYDYIVVGECEASLPELARQIILGQRPGDLDGIISRFDSPGRGIVEPVYPGDLDEAGYPSYDWLDNRLYRSYSGNHLVPIAASRGCNWRRCRFCAECFPFRKRQPGNVVDEIEFHVKNGFSIFHFNESDVNGDHDNLKLICTGILDRNLSVKMVGQLRISPKNSKEYFDLLAKAGFVHLRFGVDGWTDSLLKNQRKGYGMETVFQNLEDCHASGIRTTVNAVVGVPGETEEDIALSIEHMIQCRDSIDLIEGINTLTLAGGCEYYTNPDRYNIVFTEDRQTLYQKYPYFIPPQFWYSEEPYIDQAIRLKRTRTICEHLREEGVHIGDFVWKRLEELENAWAQTIRKDTVMAGT